MSSFQFEIQLRVINAVCSSGGTGSVTDLKTMRRSSSAAAAASPSAAQRYNTRFFYVLVDDSFYYDKCVGEFLWRLFVLI